MAIHSSTTIPPLAPPRQLAANSSATDNLNEMLKFIKLNPPLTLDSSIKIRFGIITGLMLLIGLLYLIRLVQAFLDRDYRVIERDRNGYLNPNVEVLVPVFAILNSTLGMCSIISMQHDGGRYLSRFTLTTQIFSYAFLFFCAVTRVPVQVTPFRRNLLTNGLRPSLFNALVILVYVSFPLATLPLALKVSNEIAKLGREAYEFVPNVKVIVAQYQNALPGDTTATTLMEEVITKLHSKQHLIKQLAFWWRLICVIYILYCSSLFIAFNYASARLYSTLTIQIEILSQGRRRFARMASAGMRSFDDETHFDTSQSVQSLTQCDEILKPFKKLKESIWVHSQDQSEMLKFWNSLDACTENAELARKFKMSIRYRTVVLWQWICTSITFLAFLILTFCLVGNVFDKHGVPHVKIILIVHEWAGWAWTLPGSALAFLACCVALMPHSDLRTEPNGLPGNSISKQSSREHRFQVDLSGTSLETDEVKLRSYTSFLPEVPPSTTKGTFIGELRLSGRKIWQKFPTFKPNLNSIESQRPRKFSIFSIVEDEKTEEKKSQPETGFHLHKEPLGATHYNSSSIQADSERTAPPTSQVTSDVNIIKSLRDRDS